MLLCRYVEVGGVARRLEIEFQVLLPAQILVTHQVGLAALPPFQRCGNGLGHRLAADVVDTSCRRHHGHAFKQAGGVIDQCGKVGQFYTGNIAKDKRRVEAANAKVV